MLENNILPICKEAKACSFTFLSQKFCYLQHHSNVENEAQSFLNFALKMYETLPKTLEKLAERQTNQTRMLKSIHSVKLLAGCPVMVVLLLQLFPSLLANSIRAFSPYMILSLTLSLDPGREGEPVFADFLASQAKTLSILAYCSKLNDYIEYLEENRAKIPLLVINLLRNCQKCAVETQIRKDILVAVRHIISIEKFKAEFVREIDAFLEEGLLGGNSETLNKALLPNALTLLADFVSWQVLSLEQLLKVLHLCSDWSDAKLPWATQTTGVKITMNLVRNFYHKTTPNHCRTICFKITELFVNKLNSMRMALPELRENPGNLDEWRILLKTLLHSCETIFSCINRCGVLSPLMLDEASNFNRFCKYSLACLTSYSLYAELQQKNNHGQSSSLVDKRKNGNWCNMQLLLDEKQLLEEEDEVFGIFGKALCCEFEIPLFTDFFSMNWDLFIEHIANNKKFFRISEIITSSDKSAAPQFLQLLFTNLTTQHTCGDQSFSSFCYLPTNFFSRNCSK